MLTRCYLSKIGGTNHTKSISLKCYFTFLNFFSFKLSQQRSERFSLSHLSVCLSPSVFFSVPLFVFALSLCLSNSFLFLSLCLFVSLFDFLSPSVFLFSFLSLFLSLALSFFLFLSLCPSLYLSTFFCHFSFLHASHNLFYLLSTYVFNLSLCLPPLLSLSFNPFSLSLYLSLLYFM
jgi:hypothetical protein